MNDHQEANTWMKGIIFPSIYCFFYIICPVINDNAIANKFIDSNFFFIILKSITINPPYIVLEINEIP